MLSLRLLGPVELSRDGATLPLTIRRCAALLVLLALDGPLTREQVAALLWPDLDRNIARRNLRRELVRLRDAGAADALHVDREMLALQPQVDLDTAQFDQALRQAQPEAALQLWRGALATDLALGDAPAFDEWLGTARERWATRWRDAMEASANAAEADGRAAVALERLERLLADDPLQERHWRSSMRLLQGLGRREDALARYRQCRDLLQAELGLPPMPETQAMADALLQHAPAAPARVAAAAPVAETPTPVRLPDPLPFVGREAEIAALEQAWHQRAVVVLEGEGGIGKSRLATDFAAAHGPHALVRCLAGDAALPLAGFARSLRALAGPEADTHGWPDWVRAEVARLLPELGPAPPPLRNEDERLRLSQACAHAWSAWADGSFDAMVIDDWHLADAASQTLWAQMDRHALRLLLTCRPVAGGDAAARLQRLIDAGALHRVLQPLPPDAVLDLVRQLSGAARPQRFAALLAQASGGLPFHIGALLRHLADAGQLQAGADGQWHTAFDDVTQDYRELPVPARMVDTLLLRARQLPEPAPRLLEAAALAEPPFSAALLAPACALSEVEAEMACDAARQAGLLREHERGGYAFAHDLVQQALESALEPARRRSVHRRLALGAAAAGAPAARVAAHHEAGGEPARAIVWRQRAFDDAMKLLALDEALAQGRQALANGAEGDQALALCQGNLRVLELLGRDDEALAEADALLQRPGGSPAARAEARIAVATYLANRELAPRALALLDELPPALDPALRVKALRARAGAQRVLGRVDEAREALEEALALHPQPDSERVSLLSLRVAIEMTAGRMHDGLAFTDQTLALSRAVGDTLGMARAQSNLGPMLMAVGRQDEAEATLLASAATFERFGMRSQQSIDLFNLCALYAAQSRPADVLRMAQAAWNVKRAMELDPLRLHVQLAFIEAHVGLGQLGQAWGWLQTAAVDAQALGQTDSLCSLLNTGAELLAVVGDGQQLQALRQQLDLDALRDAHFAAAEVWVMLTEAALTLGDTDAARETWQHALRPEQIEVETVRQRHRLVAALMQLADGHAAEALAGLPPPDAPDLSPELRWRALAVRLAAEAALGGPTEASVQVADQALSGPAPQALAALQLHRALVAAAPSPARHQALDRHVQALADSLAGQPAQQQAFVAQWRNAPATPTP